LRLSMNDEEPTPKTESSGNLKPPRPPKPPVTAAAEDGDEGDRRRETVRISLPPKAKETVRIAIPKEPPAG
jgi:hypothetical protein